MLTLDNVSVSYGEVQALWDVSLDIHQGEIVALVGSNGAGKSTTLKTISGLMHPRGGAIVFEGRPIQHAGAHEIVDMGIAHIPEGRRLWANMTVRENLEMGAYARRARKAVAQTMADALRLFPRLAERSNQLAGTLSGGEQQMLAIARGLLSRPKLLMLDEPSLGLAPVLVSEVFRIVQDINREGVTILLVEQNTQHALAIASRAYVLETGRVVMSGSGAELLNNPQVREAYLGL
ncbi:MAG: ABC transporter ATP-binding protein [Chloroflexi bacterium]|nr:ABC transporter ATP-binding protein [Chloroflexota bacterium]